VHRSQVGAASRAWGARARDACVRACVGEFVICVHTGPEIRGGLNSCTTGFIESGESEKDQSSQIRASQQQHFETAANTRRASMPLTEAIDSTAAAAAAAAASSKQQAAGRQQAGSRQAAGRQ
jgi:hypothetical protein